MICGVEICVAEPTANNSDIDACGNQMNSRRMAKRVRGDVLTGQRWRLLRCRPDVPIQFETDPGGPERLSITVDEDRLIVRPRLPFQQGFDEVHGFRPEGA